MTFNEESITLSPQEKEALGLTEPAIFKWGELDLLHRVVAAAFATEFECEMTYFETLRATCDDTETAFRSGTLPNFDTYGLGQMLVKLDRVAEAQ